MGDEIKDLIETVLKRVLSEELGSALPAEELARQAQLEVPRDRSHGDLTTTVALKLAGRVGRKPRELAEALCRALAEAPEVTDQLANVEVAGPGFINFTLAGEPLQDLLRRIQAEGAGYGPRPTPSPRRVLIEFVSANPTGPLVVVGGRQAAVGDALANILQAVGHSVTREYYINDSGTQMALFGRSVLARYRQVLGVEDQLPEEGYHGEYLIDIARRIEREYGGRFLEMPEEEAVPQLAELACRINLASIRKDLEDFGVRFDNWFSQLALERSGAPRKLLERLDRQGLIYRKDGAIWMRTSGFGDDADRVLVKSNGDLTYRTTDIAYHEDKFARGYDLLINLWGPDHHGHAITMAAALRALGHNLDQFHVLIVQHCTLLSGGRKQSMSKRAGQVVRLRDLVDEVGVDAARWFFIMRRTDSHLDFDLELAKEQSAENPVYYVQYAHARIASIYAKARERCDWLRSADFREGRFLPETIDLSPLSERDRSLVPLLRTYPEVVTAAARHYEPHRLTNYLYDLATHFHAWYTYGDRHPQHRVIVGDESLTRARLYLVAAVQVVLANGLGLLGVSAPTSM